MDIEVTGPVDGVVTITLGEKLDASTVDEFFNAWLDIKPSEDPITLNIDFRHTLAVGSAGIAALTAMHKTVRTPLLRVKLVNMTDKVRNQLTLGNLDAYFELT